MPDKRARGLEAAASDLLPQGIAFLADANGILPEFRAKGLLDEQDALKSRDIDVVEQPPEPPTHGLTGHAEGLMDLLSVGPAKDHPAGLIRLQLYPEIVGIHQLSQGLQESLVLLRKLHVSSHLLSYGLNKLV